MKCPKPPYALKGWWDLPASPHPYDPYDPIRSYDPYDPTLLGNQLLRPKRADAPTTHTRRRCAVLSCAVLRSAVLCCAVLRGKEREGEVSE